MGGRQSRLCVRSADPALHASGFPSWSRYWLHGTWAGAGRSISAAAVCALVAPRLRPPAVPVAAWWRYEVLDLARFRIGRRLPSDLRLDGSERCGWFECLFTGPNHRLLVDRLLSRHRRTVCIRTRSGSPARGQSAWDQAWASFRVVTVGGSSGWRITARFLWCDVQQ